MLTAQSAAKRWIATIAAAVVQPLPRNVVQLSVRCQALCGGGTGIPESHHQNIPRIVPLMRAKRTVKPNEGVGIQTAKQAIPHAKVRMVTTLILPKWSLRKPIKGRPTAVPRFRNATILVDWDRDKRMDRAKSGRE